MEADAEDLPFEDASFDRVLARAAVGDRWPDLRRDISRLFEEWNAADDGSVRIEAEYLMTVGRKRTQE